MASDDTAIDGKVRVTYDPDVELTITDARIAWVLGHAGISPWLKRTLREAIAADPVAVANDVEILRHLLQPRAAAWAQKQVDKTSGGVRDLD